MSLRPQTVPHRIVENRRIDPRLNRDIPFSPEAVIRRKVSSLGGEAALGGVARKDGNAWYFNDGSCVAYNATQHAAFRVFGAIYQKWIALGGMAWGVPDTDETATPDAVGRFNHFAGNTASIYWTPETGAHAIWGAIRVKWASLGWERSPLGYPVTDELGTPDGIGRYNHFSSHGSIYWTPQTGAQAIGGAIRARWEQLGWERSYLGYPTSDEGDFPEGGRASTFQNGGIYWWGDTGAIDLRDVAVNYTGLACFGETDNDQTSASDEPYVIVSGANSERSATIRSPIYEEVDDGDGRADLIELYRGKPYGLAISCVLMEHDFGDPDRYKEEVTKVVEQVAKGVTAGIAAIPVVGPPIAVVAGPVLQLFVPALGGALSDLFDWGDDRVGSQEFTISAKQMVVLAARTQPSAFRGVLYKVESPLVSGFGATYKIHFTVEPV